MGKSSPKTIEKLLVEGYANGGKGIAKHEGKIIFLPATVAGDVVDVLITRKRKNWMEGKVLRYHHYSPHRITPACVHFEHCGGCKWQMLPYPNQLDLKQEEIQGLFTHHSHLQTSHTATHAICASEHSFHYRNKMEFSFSNRIYHTPQSDADDTLDKKRGALGLHAPGRFDKIVPIQTCFLMHPQHNEIRNTIYQIAVEKNYSLYDVYTHQGTLRNVQIRRSEYSGAWLVWLIFGESSESVRQEMLQEIEHRLPFVDELHYAVNTKCNDSLHDLIIQQYKGKGYIEERLGHLRFQIDSKSFFQTNTKQALALYQIVREMANPQKDEVLYDLYCGMGTIGLFLAPNVQKVVGIESIPEAIEAAKANSTLNHIANVSWHLGKAEDVMKYDFVETYGAADTIILDPPRAGLHEKLISTLLHIGAKKIVYVSCNPATQVRDMEGLSSHYEVLSMQAVDMFPQTHHLENVALLHKK